MSSLRTHKSKKFDTIAEEIATDLKWFFPSAVNQYTSLCLMYKIVNYKLDYFNSLVHPYYTRLRTNLHCTGVPRTNYATSTFYYNFLNIIRNLKNNLKSFLLDLQTQQIGYFAKTLTNNVQFFIHLYCSYLIRT